MIHEGATPGTVAVALAANSRYDLPLAVTLCSTLANLEPGRELVAYVIDDGLLPGARDRVARSTANGPCTLRWLPAPTAAVQGLPCWGDMPATTYSRLLLADLLPESVNRVIWLDCDLLVLGNLAELWATPLGVASTGAVRDPFIPCLGSRCGLRGVDELALPEDASYFNAGVMLIDLDRWRRSDVGGQALEFMRQYGDRVHLQDQAALNAVLFGSWTELPSRWNSTPHSYSAGRTSVREGGAGILHFAGSFKPWRFAGSSLAHQRYLEYLDRTTWAGWRPPHGLTGSLMRLYEESALRELIRPLEQRVFEAYMTATRR